MQEENIQPKKVRHIKRGWLATKSAWTVFKLDKELSVFALISTVLVPIIGVIGFLVGFIFLPGHKIDTNNFHPTPGTIAVWLSTLAVIYLLTTYASAAIIASALKRFRGGDPTIKDGLRSVKTRFGSLTLFALFNMGVGQGLQYIENRVPFAGKVLTFFAQMAWTVASIFAIPVIVDSNQPIGPIKAVKGSGGIIKKAWAEAAISQASVASIFFLLAFMEIGISVAAIGLVNHNYSGTSDTLTGIMAGVMGIILLVTIILATALSSIVKAAVYHYAITGETPEHFNRELMKQAFTAKKARKLFR